MTYDDQCHGSTTLYAVLNFLNDSVVSQIQARHRHIEWLKFLKQSDANVAPDMRIHVLLDNYATHKLPTALKWLAKHQRFPSRFTAASASWMNMMARFFKNLSEDRLKRTVFKAASTAACETTFVTPIRASFLSCAEPTLGEAAPSKPIHTATAANQTWRWPHKARLVVDTVTSSCYSTH